MTIPPHFKRIEWKQLMGQLERRHDEGHKFKFYFAATDDECIVFDRDTDRLMAISMPGKVEVWMDPSFML